MKKKIPSSRSSLSPNQKLSNPVPRTGLVCNSRRRVQSSVLPDMPEPLPRAWEKFPEIPNASSAATSRTNADNRYVPIKFLFTERMPTNTTISIPTIRDIDDVALCACEKSHQIPIKNPAISRSSSRLQRLRSLFQVCSKYQKKKNPRIMQSAPSPFLPSAMPLFAGMTVQSSSLLLHTS